MGGRPPATYPKGGHAIAGGRPPLTTLGGDHNHPLSPLGVVATTLDSYSRWPRPPRCHGGWPQGLLWVTGHPHVQHFFITF